MSQKTKTLILIAAAAILLLASLWAAGAKPDCAWPKGPDGRQVSITQECREQLSQ